jgi:glycosyltransferase involved in cell wall biosynthesis
VALVRLDGWRHNNIMLPVVLLSFNRLALLQRTIDSIHNAIDDAEILILDFGSTWDPLLTYLHTNFNGRIIWESPLQRPRDFSNRISGGLKQLFHINKKLLRRSGGFYAITDPDIEFNETIPRDLLLLTKDLFANHVGKVDTVGPSFMYDDLSNDLWIKMNLDPLTKTVKAQSYDYEWSGGKASLCRLPVIDTTFAIRNWFQVGFVRNSLYSIRLGGPYWIRHLPWYDEYQDLDKCDIYDATANHEISNIRSYTKETT